MNFMEIKWEHSYPESIFFGILYTLTKKKGRSFGQALIECLITLNNISNFTNFYILYNETKRFTRLY